MTSLTIFMLIMLFVLLRVSRGLSPCAVFGTIAAANQLVFYVTYYLGVASGSLRYFWVLNHDYGETMYDTAAFYSFMVALALVAATAAYLLHTSCSMPSEPQASMKLRYVPPVFTALNSASVLVPIVIVDLLYIAYAIRIDWSPVLFHTDYLFLGDAANLGISDPVFRLLHGAMAPIGLAWSFLTGYYLATKNKHGMALTLPLFLLVYLFALASGSRMAGVQFAILALVAQVTSRKPVSLVALFCAAWAAFMFYVALDIRNSGALGLIGVWRRLDDFETSSGDFSANLLTLTFSGGYVLADALRHADLWYPTGYKILSFSPLPSIIDGFGMSYLHYQHRVAWWIPYSCIAEAYHFGFWYMLFYVSFVGVLLCRLQWCWYRLPPSLSLAVSGPAFVSMLAMHSYPIRNTFRMFVLSLILSFTVPWLLAHQAARRRRSVAGQDDTEPRRRRCQGGATGSS
jgi:hypothetical protein